MQEIEKIFQGYNFNLKAQKPQTSILDIENVIKFPLPPDYAFYLKNYLSFADMIVEQYVQLWDIDEIITLNNSYGILDNLSKTIGIGTNGGGEFIAIEFLFTSNYQIVLSPFIDLNKQYHIEIGTSFTDFLIRLSNREEWFK